MIGLCVCVCVCVCACVRVCQSVINSFGNYGESGHFGSCLSTQSNELTAFLCLVLTVADKKLPVIFCGGF